MKLILYLFRWQLSTLTLWPVLQVFGNGLSGVIIANLIGGLIFFGIDRAIFNRQKTRRVGDVSFYTSHLRLLREAFYRARARNGKR